MRYKHILLFITFALFVHGCGSNSNNIELSDEQRLEKEAREYAERDIDYFRDYDGRPLSAAEKKPIIERIMEQYIAAERETAKYHAAIKANPRIQYIFNNTLEIDSPEFGITGEGPSYRGSVSKAFKQIIRNIWSSLSEKGFSGFNAEHLADDKEYSFYLSKPGGTPYDTTLVLPASEQNFAYRYIQSFVDRPRYYPSYRDYLDNHLKNVSTLLGLKFNNKAFTLVKTASDTYEAVLAEEFRQAPTGQSQYDYIPIKIDSDTPVTEAQLKEWNQVFVDALKADPFFKQSFEPLSLSDGSSMVSLLAARTGKTGVDAAHLSVNGIPGSHIDLGLPVFVQLKGSIDQKKSTNLTTGTVAYKLGNTVIGAIQTYSNSGTGFGHDGRQLETSVVASHSFGSFFIEGQLGSVTATDVHFKDWSGSRTQLTIGVDTPWVSPFIQVSYRNLNNQSDTAVYGGLEVDLSEFKTDGYTFNTHLLAKAGYSNVKGTTGAVEWSGTLTLNSGVSFATNLTLGTAAEPSIDLTFKLDR